MPRPFCIPISFLLLICTTIAAADDFVVINDQQLGTSPNFSTLIIRTQITLSANRTVNHTKCLRFSRGGKIIVPLTKTLTIKGGI